MRKCLRSQMMLLERFASKRAWQQLFNSGLPDFDQSFTVCDEHLSFRRIFRQQLPACTTGHRTTFAPSHDRDRHEISFPFRQRLEQCHPFGAARQTVARALHVCACDDFPVSGEQRRAHEEFRVRCHSPLARFCGGEHQSRFCRPCPSSWFPIFSLPHKSPQIV